MKIAIVTDSNSGISNEQAKELGITVIPMPFLIDGEEYFENVNLTQHEFYQKLKQNADVSTSQPSIYSIVEIWKELLKTHDQIVHIPMSSSLSGCYETALNFAKEFDGKVQVVNNRRLSVTHGQSVLDAVKLASEGKNAVEIKEFLEKTALDYSIYCLVSTLKYLKKGGRISPAVALIGSLLNIKPIMQFNGGKVEKFSQTISSTLGKRKMVDTIIHDLKTKFAEQLKQGKIKICIAYTGDNDKNEKVEAFKTFVNNQLKPFNLKVSEVAQLPLSIACHIGDGAIAIVCEYAY